MTGNPGRRIDAVVTVSCVALVAGTLYAGGAPRRSPPAVPAFERSSAVAVIDTYCVTCHSERLKTGGLTLEGVSLDRPVDNAQVWEKVIGKLRAGMMPPPGRPRPDADTADAFRSWLEAAIDRDAAVRPNPGRTETFHRLNRTEYQNAVRDLLAVDVDVTSLLPADDMSYGFDNIAGVQRISPTLTERYLTAARRITKLAVGYTAVSNSETFVFADDATQDGQADGLPFGTRGGQRIRYIFPADGEYVLRVQLTREIANDAIADFAQPQPLEVSIDGEQLHVFTMPAAAQRQDTGYSPNMTARRNLDDGWQIRFAAKAGPRSVTVAWLNRAPALLENHLEPFVRPYAGGVNQYTTKKGLYVSSVDITGPIGVSLPPTNTPSRRRIFTCTPGSSVDAGACAKTILTRLARRAYRRPVTAADVQPLIRAYETAAGEHFEAGIERAIETLLVMPDFLFRVERDPARVPPDTNYAVSGIELASRLSFFLWSSLPDDELLNLAVGAALRQPHVLDAQVRRMLADPRSSALVENFVGQWLLLRNLASLRPDPKKAPDFDDGLRQGFKKETVLLFDSILRDSRSALDLLTADYTFVNERLARHYGMPGVVGTNFRRVRVADPRRFGLLGHGSVLTVTARADRTSPVQRGKWILDNLIGTPPPDPPANVPALPPTEGEAQPTSMRDRMARHRANPACAGCHGIMDPLGFALENFNLVGSWRDLEDGMPIDASGALPNGTKFNSVIELRAALLRKPDTFVGTLTSKLLTYALGRGLEAYDAPVVRKIVRDAAGDNYRLSTLVLEIVKSVPFQMRRSPAIAPGGGSVARRPTSIAAGE